MWLSVLFTLSAQAAEYRCPDIVFTDQSIEKVPKGWTASQSLVNNQQTLERITIFDGHPNQGATISPEKDSWIFKAKANPMWIGCFYRMTKIRLLKELPKATKSCSMMFKTQSKIATGDRLVCQ